MGSFGRFVVSSAILGLAFAPVCPAAEIQCEKPPAKLLLLRHGCKLDDSSDTALSPRGQEQAAELIQRLGSYDLEAIFVTTRLRTQQTAQPLAEHKHLEPLKRPASALGAVETAKEVCSGKYSKAVLFIGHSDTLDDALHQIVPDFVYDTPSCAEGWILDFSKAAPVPERLAASGIECERPCK